MTYNIEKIRNIGISAHIDSGKTTLTERILFYTNKIHAVHEVRGKDGVGATMDSMELEKERGITISSASTNVTWKDSSINIIDTPGHVDFTIEVENALRVLDGAILVLCSVAGVQSQSITVDRQMKRYGVPSIAFVNKLDRIGANPYKVKDQLIEKLDRNAVMAQIPIGLEDKFEGIVDLIEMKAIYFEGENGTKIRLAEIPEHLIDEARNLREELVDKASSFSDELMEAYLDGKVTNQQLKNAIRKGVLLTELTPVFMGSAFKFKGVQTLLDYILEFLPSPIDRKNVAYDLLNKEAEVELSSSTEKETVAMAFKLENQIYGQLTYVRIYQGKIKKGDDLFNVTQNKRVKIGRLIRMHANSMEDIEEAYAGDIIALFGIDCALGDSFVSGNIKYSLKSMFVPEPIISLAISAHDKKSQDNMSKALNRFIKEDPTFKVFVDEESNETIIKGMGELHLDVYLERMKREYKADIEVGMPQVSYRETITEAVKFDYIHKKQTGGRGQFARVVGFIEPSGSDENEFVDDIKGGVIPATYMPATEKGFFSSLDKGSLIGFPVVGVSMTINDGNFHPVDSSNLAFELASIQAFKEAYRKSKPRILEPIMKLTVEMPSEFRGTVLSSINQRRGLVLDTIVDGAFTSIDATIPLAEVFGYATVLRSLTQGKSEFTLEFLKYDKVPKNIEEQIIKDIQAKNANQV
ncbi:MAG: elongation factor G [Candidatus Cloacimonadales bacterium]|jgi:elongation factor G|nr:elongation factor G [Candidatus Cloacimonadota bacterium]MDD2649833.1 elongation factor G [Candidatus Cloacimonadota bacterium]MDD3502040.1 elongation factor G [Candidatus Cloacimonadota bacterium]MDX9977695.1 elongation factor G [Candidatus Cloacimonadales bacterium]